METLNQREGREYGHEDPQALKLGEPSHQQEITEKWLGQSEEKKQSRENQGER
jgi:hypothetical protein